MGSQVPDLQSSQWRHPDTVSYPKCKPPPPSCRPPSERIHPAPCNEAAAGRVSNRKLGDFVCFGTESPGLPYAPSLTQESYRPRVSDRTMVGNSATRLACEFQRAEWRRHDSEEYEPTGMGKKHPGLIAPRLTEPLRDRPKRSSSC